MKLIMENWGSFINEQASEENIQAAIKAIASNDQVKEVERASLPRANRQSFSREKEFMQMFPDGIAGIEISDPSMSNWNPDVTQIVYQGSDGRYHFFKLSTTGKYFVVMKPRNQ